MVCQCPSTGLHHFYLIVGCKLNFVARCVNALQRAYIISTFSEGKLQTLLRRCVNALQRAYIISTLIVLCMRFPTQVSMPFNGLTSFLLVSCFELQDTINMCQCPSTGLHHFYCVNNLVCF